MAITGDIYQSIIDGVIAAYEKATEFHFEKRDELNKAHPSYSEVRLPNSEWKRLGPDMSKYHDNGQGKPELKFVHPDGREAVFDGDTLLPMTDPRYKGTYNYVVPVPMPENKWDIFGWFEYVEKTIIGHGIKDWLPYKLTGSKNERDQGK